MGLDLYVGPLTRYHLGGWLSTVQQAGRDLGITVEIDRHGTEPQGSVTDPDTALAAVRRWQIGLGLALGCTADWPEDAKLPYWTDKPDWDGYGAVLLLAAYDERPDLRPDRSGVPLRQPATDQPRAYDQTPAYQAASLQPQRYPSLLRAAEWWLPLPNTPPLVFRGHLDRAGSPPGWAESTASSPNCAYSANAANAFATHDRQAVLAAGPPRGDAPTELAARFGLAVPGRSPDRTRPVARGPPRRHHRR